MSDSHGNTPAAWAGVAVAMLGFVVAGIGLMFDPIRISVFWVGAAIVAASIVVFAVMSRMGLNGSSH